MELRKYFPTTQQGAEIYGGFIFDKWHFGKIFKIESSIEGTIDKVNQFLVQNGYSPCNLAHLDNNNSYEGDDQILKLWLNPYQDGEIVLVIRRDISSYEVPALLIEVLKQFRNERDWDQFHNPKDLAIALNIESSELLELFLWKKHEDANETKIKDELADVFAYALLLADKYNFNIEEMVLNKVKKNAEKYPIDKAKGTAKKYNEL